MMIIFVIFMLFLMWFWASMGVAYVLYAVVGVWLAICLLWAPFAGWLLVRASPDRFDSSSDKARRFLLGAVTSALFLAPWVYLFLHYKGKRWVGISHARKMYKVLYGIWIAGAFHHSLLFSIWGTAFVFWGEFGDSWSLFLSGAVAPLAALALQVRMFIQSRRSLRRRLEEDSRDAATDVPDAPVIDFRAQEYLRPFVLTYIWTVLGALHYGIAVLPDLCEGYYDFPASLLPVCY